MDGADPGPLIVVDLASSRLARSMVRRAATRAIARALAAATAPAAATAAGRAAREDQPAVTPRVLVHGSDPGFIPPRDVEVLRTVERAAPAIGSAIEPWIVAVAREVVYGKCARFFPSVRGICLADLCLLEVQDYYLEFIRLAGALQRVLAEKPVSVCSIFSSDPERAEALRWAAAGLAAHAEAWAPPFIRGIRSVGRGLRDGLTKGRPVGAPGSPLPAPLASAPPGKLEASVLFISEAAPMAHMFRVAARHLADEHRLRSVRVEFGHGDPALSIEEKGMSVVAALGRPGVVPPVAVGRFQARWRSIAREARSTVLDEPYRGAPAATPMRAPIGHLMERLYVERFDQLTEHIALAEAIIDRVRPDVLVVGNDRWWVGQTFVRVAQRRGIPTLLMQDGLAVQMAHWSWTAADYVAAFSPTWGHVLAAYGLARDRVIITGQPRYDELCEKRKARSVASVAAARRTLGVADHKVCVLFATQPHQEPERVGDAVRALLEIDGVHVLLRPHPHEASGKYAAYLRGASARVSTHAGPDIGVLLDAADVLVTEYSTVALEAAIVGIPVIIATFLGDAPIPEVFDGLSVAADSPAALRDAARALASKSPENPAPIDSERLHALVGPLDGHAGRRVAALIESLRQAAVDPSRPKPRSAPATPRVRAFSLDEAAHSPMAARQVVG